MIERNVVIPNETGMHARASAEFISFVYRFNCDIFIIKGTQVANAKSILNLIMLSLNHGTEVTIRVSGENEEDVLEKVINYISEMKD